MGKTATFASRLKTLLTVKQMTQAELSRKTGISKSSITHYVKGDWEGKQDAVYAIATETGVSEAWLMGYDVPMERTPISKKVNSDPSSTLLSYNPTHRIPVLGRISAGLPLYADEHIEGYTYTELNGGAEYFALRVSGDSMTAARINDGDLLVVRKQDIVDNGEIAVVIVGDDEATVKRFYRDGSTVTLMPQSTNPIHQPQIYNTKETHIRVIGRVVRNQISY